MEMTSLIQLAWKCSGYFNACRETFKVDTERNCKRLLRAPLIIYIFPKVAFNLMLKFCDPCFYNRHALSWSHCNNQTVSKDVGSDA